MKRVVVTALLASLAAGMLAHSGAAQAQIARTSRGKEFYGMVMKYSGTPDMFGGYATNHYIRVFLSSEFAANATVSISDGSFSQNVSIAPNVVTTVELPFSVEDDQPWVPTLQSIRVAADTDISVYIIYHKRYSTDSYMALPVVSLGNDYITACYPSSSEYGDKTASEFGIVATQDSTQITITPSSTTQYNMHAPGAPFTITLNKGQEYLVYGDETDGGSDLTGSGIEATKPVAVFSGHDRTEIAHDQGQSRDCLVEQIPSNGTLGTSFITVPFVPRKPPVGDYFRIVAPIDSTTIIKDGATAATINTGQYYDFMALQPVQIQTNNPVLLAQYSLSATDSTGQYNAGNGYGGIAIPWDPAMMIIPPTQQFLSNYTFANSIDSAFIDSYVNVVIPSGAVASLRLDGAPVATPFTAIPGSGFSYAQIQTSQGSHHITASDSFGIYVYGFGPADSYANTGGAAFKVLNGLLVTTTDIDFGSVWVDTCKDSTLEFRNVGQAPITVWKLALADSDAGDFSIIAGAPPFTMAPGDSHLVTVNFCPSAAGYRGKARVLITSNAAEHPIITMHGVGLKGGLVASAGSLDLDTARADYDYANLDCYSDSTITLKNTNNVEITIDSIVVTGQDASDFSATPAGALAIPPGASVKITITFRPSSDGSKNAVLAIYSTGNVLQIPLSAVGVSAVLESIPSALNFGKVKIGETVLDTIALINTSQYMAVLEPNYFTFSGGADFQIVSYNGTVNLGGTLGIPAHDTVMIIVRFTPRTSGEQVGYLQYHYPYCHSVGGGPYADISQLNGAGAYPSLSLTPIVVDYKRVKMGKEKDSTLTLLNAGAVTAAIKQYAITGADAQDFVMPANISADSLPPDSLVAGGSAPLIVGFAPLDTGRKHAQLVVTSDDSVPQVVADLYGNGVPGSFAVITSTDTIHGRVGQIIRVPVALLTPMDEADVAKYHIVLRYDSTMLWPLGVSADSAWSAADFMPALTGSPGTADVAARAPQGATLQGDGTLYYVAMQVLLGDALETPLLLSAARYSDATGDSTAVTSAVHHGLFILDGYCGGAAGLVTASGDYSLGSISPNPLGGGAQVSYQIAVAGRVHIGLYNALGEQALRLVDADEQPGRYAAYFDAAALPNGAYLLVMQSGLFRQTRRIVVAR